MRVHGAVTSVSWIPSEAVTGPLRTAFDRGPGHYDPPPDDRVGGLDELKALRDADAFRFAHRLSGWAELEDGAVVDSGYAADSDGVMGGTTVAIGPARYSFVNVSLPMLQARPAGGASAAVLRQTFGGRTSAPLPRLVDGVPFVRVVAPIVWTTLTLRITADGEVTGELSGASAFPRHWLYGTDGALTAKSGLADFTAWTRRSSSARTPWGDSDSPALVSRVESAVERQLSTAIMRGGTRPRIFTLGAGEVLTRQGEPGTDVFLLLDGLLEVDVDDRSLGEVGPGAVLGERASLARGTRTATLTATTPVRVAAVDPTDLDPRQLHALTRGHRRESP